jgi:3-methylcrotonyl-CoA carboxylase beta subunit
MGGEQAAGVLATVRQQSQEAKGGAPMSADEVEKFKKPILEKYEQEGSAYYSSARLWDDGIIDPTHTRDVLGMGLDMTLNAPINDSRYGIFRM